MARPQPPVSRPPRSPAGPIAPTAPSSPFSAWPRWKKFSVTGLFAIVIVSGTIWGASLKMHREAKVETKKVRQTTTDEKVWLLEQRRAHLVKQKDEIESKLSDLHARMRARESGLGTR